MPAGTGVESFTDSEKNNIFDYWFTSDIQWCLHFIWWKQNKHQK